MTWAILALIIAVALYLFGGMLIKHDMKKPVTLGVMVAKKSIKLLSIVILVIGVARLWTPYYLTSVNPGIVMEMVKGVQAGEQGKSSGEIKKYVKKHMKEMIANAPILGNVEAKKTIFLFTDYSCPYCARVGKELEKVLADNKDVRVVIKNFSIHGVLSDGAARAMIASRMQAADGCSSEKLNNLLTEKPYWPDDLKGQSQEALEKTILKNVLAAAKKAGCDVEKMEADMRSEIVNNELAQVGELAQRFGIQGTPFLIIQDQAFPGAVPAAQIQQALK